MGKGTYGLIIPSSQDAKRLVGEEHSIVNIPKRGVVEFYY